MNNKSMTTNIQVFGRIIYNRASKLYNPTQNTPTRIPHRKNEIPNRGPDYSNQLSAEPLNTPPTTLKHQFSAGSITLPIRQQNPLNNTNPQQPQNNRLHTPLHHYTKTTTNNLNTTKTQQPIKLTT